MYPLRGYFTHTGRAPQWRDTESESCRLRRDEGFAVRSDDGEGFAVRSDDGKHSVRLYAGRIRWGRAPAPPAPEGEKGNAMQRRKTEIVTARMTPKVKAQLQQRAQEANLTLTDYLCICGLGKEIIRVEGLDAVLSELKAQGRNLNQLTTLANMGRLTVLRSDELIDKYADLCAAIRRLTKEVH